ncbi:non-ribosomal peptide synthetase [Fortiea contorta]|uniref:non-ribosomal peptide synthetase n=1 Tax=Fortiea contorta TaxID=1892405 RepID=UPI00034CBDA4|nr:non-ribosomal peptide synthetase [Fortiea contorta]
MSDIIQRIAALTPEKRALLELRLKQKNLLQKKWTSIAKRKAQDALYLSLIQEKFWIIQQLQPDLSAYNESNLLKITGNLNKNVLEKSLNTIIQRHEILRTSFRVVDGQTIQNIAPAIQITLPIVDLQDCSKIEQEAKVKQLVIEHSSLPFDITEAPLLRAVLIRLQEQEYLLLFTIHHIIFDGWSSRVFYQELAALYQGFCQDIPVILPELPIQYADFALWQRQSLNNEEKWHQLTYWKQQLQDAPPILNLPTDYPRPAQQSFRGARATIIITEAIAHALKSLSQQAGVTLFMVILAAFKTLLYRYTGQTDLLVGTPVANRTQIETENLLGCFVNSVVLRTDVAGEPSFRDLVKRVRETALAAYAHQDLPFEQLVKELQPERTFSHTPLFQVMCVFQDTPLSALELPGLTLAPLMIDNGTAKFDLTLYLEDTKQELIGFLEYNSDLFHPDTINRMVEHFQTLLAGIIANPDQCIAKLPLLTQQEQNQLIANNLPIKIDDSSPLTLHQLFEQQAEKTPDAVAVVFGEQQLTYAELNIKANQIAHYLQKLGIKTAELVGISLPRSLDMIIGILGILKAGAAYVPLDPNYPIERLAFILEDAQLQVILTQKQLCQKLATNQTQLVYLDADGEIAQQSRDNPSSQATSASLAYIIYTSGSTGQPKGVLVNHHNVMRLFAATDAWFKFNHQDVWTLFHSIAFDFSVWEIWGALLYGGRLVVVPYEMTRSPQAFYELLSQQQVTVLNQTPSAFRQLIKVDESTPTPQQLNLRYVIFGGESLEIASLQPWFDRYGDKSPQLINMYGITETTVHVTYSPLTIADLTPVSGSVIGRPIPDLQVYVLDQHQQLLPIGVAGEMYIGGAGLAQGYLHRPELTAEKFISHQLAPETRLYRSGDLARYLPNGELEYLGRIDNQVKIRGFRIELGEIETTLCQHPNIRETVVLPWEDAVKNQRLVAYIVPKLEPAPTTKELQNWLKEKLPEYMIPAFCVSLPALPLTTNGKVNRRALPAPNTVKPELDRAFVAPRTKIEQVLADIWAQVLGVARVGIDDNFFELGGDSILSTQIIAKANQAGLQLTFRKLFTHQTIAELATVTDITPTTPAEQGVIVGEVPLTPIQHWFFEQNLPDAHHWNQAVLLELEQTIEPALIAKAWQYLLIHHDALRLRFVTDGVNWQQQIVPPDGEILFKQVDLSTLSATEQTQAISEIATELQASLDLSTGPLVRIALFNLAEKQPNRLLIVIHHLVIDGVSWRILLEDLQTVYQQLSRGEDVNLLAKTTSYKQWAEQLKEYAQSNVLEKDLEYWLAIDKVDQLPVDYSQGANTEASACNVSIALNLAETKALLQEVPKVYHTQINDVLLTALIKTFADWTGKNELLIDLEGHGREDIFTGVNLSRTVGWFTAIFPVFLTLEADASAGEALKSIKEQLRAIPQQGIGYGVLRYLSGNQIIIQQMRSLPSAEISFNYFGQFDQALPQKLLRLTQDFPGVSRSPKALRRHLLDINGFVVEGQLRLEWTYSKNIYRPETVEKLAQSYLEQMRSLLVHCQSGNTPGFTPADFPKAKLTQKALDQFLASITKASGEG